MTYSELFTELAICHPGRRHHPLNVIDVRTLPKAIYTVPEMVVNNSFNHLDDREIANSRTEFYSRSTSYYVLVSQDSAHTTWHQDYTSTSVFYAVLTEERIFFLVEPSKKNLSIFGRWSNAENNIT